MNVFASLGIPILSMLIIVSMKLIPGIFALFYHYASGKYSSKKVADLTVFFILGAETLPVIIFLIINYILCGFIFTNLEPTSKIFLWIIAGLLIALGISFFLFYFRKSRATELFISRKTARALRVKSEQVKTRSDAFILGFIAGIPELLFTLPLYLISFIEICENNLASSSFFLIIFILLTISPLFLLYLYFRNDNNLASFEKLRVKNKPFFRIFISTLYFLLGLLIILFGIYL